MCKAQYLSQQRTWFRVFEWLNVSGQVCFTGIELLVLCGQCYTCEKSESHSYNTVSFSHGAYYSQHLLSCLNEWRWPQSISYSFHLTQLSNSNLHSKLQSFYSLRIAVCRQWEHIVEGQAACTRSAHEFNWYYSKPRSQAQTELYSIQLWLQFWFLLRDSLMSQFLSHGLPRF